MIISFLSDLGPSVLNHLIEPENGALNLEKLRDELNRSDILPSLHQAELFAVLFVMLELLLASHGTLADLMNVLA